MQTNDPYEESGVSLARGDFASEDARKKLRKTFNESVSFEQEIPTISLNRVIPFDWTNPCLASAVDGVGTKLIYAAVGSEFSTIGQDLVAMVVDDLARYNIKPIKFCLYRGANTIVQEYFSEILDGVVEGCIKAGTPLITGETAEMPGFYIPPHFEVVGFSEGIYEHGTLRKGQNTKVGDALVALPSLGLGSNGFSKIRDIWSPWETIAGKCSASIEDVLVPTPIYCLDVLAANKDFPSIRGWAHITGGGLGERGKLPQLLPKGMAAELDYASWYTPDIYEDVENDGDLTKDQMADAFNLGLMMVAPIASEDAQKVVDNFKGWGVEASIVGRVVEQTEEKRVLINW